MKLYLDNAATSYPKPKEVYQAMNDYMINLGASPGRGSYASALDSSRIVYNCREELCSLFNFDTVENVIFTSNITHSLNILINGFIKEGMHVITSSMEHNSVLRPLHTLKNFINYELDIIKASNEGLINIEDIKNSIKENTKLIILTHSSNVIGTLEPLEEIGLVCKQKGIFFIIDSAQTAGITEVDFKKLNCNALAFTGHKGLLGPQGIGGFLIDDSFNEKCSSIFVGGTGSLSSDLLQPDFLPDKFESGTLNTPGIAGLLAGINFITSVGINSIKEKEEFLTQKLIDGLLNIDDVILYGLKTSKNRTSAISMNFRNIDSSEVAYTLDSQFGIMTRTGLHCAPLAHKTIGTYPTGTLRMSLGYFNDEKDVDYTLFSLNKILKNLK